MFGYNKCGHKWNPSLNMVQTCSLCGMERVVPCPSHRWVRKEVFNVTNITTGRRIGDNWVMQCERCGEVKTVRIGDAR